MLVMEAVLASGVESLREGLKTFEHSTREMGSIYDSFERRLSVLERDMLPMKDISTKLNVARRNITKAVEKMEEVNEFFLLEAEVRSSVLGGIRAAPSAELYVDEVRRVVEAEQYFKGWPGLRSQEDALKGLSALSAAATKECLGEFNRLMQTVGPTVRFPSQSALSSASVYGGRGDGADCEAVDPLTESAAAALGGIAACLTLLGQGSQLRQGYSAARGLCVRSALSTWEDRHESAASQSLGLAGTAGSTVANEAKGGGAWLRKYLDFVILLVSGERLLWERVLASEADDSSGSGGSGAAEAAEMEGAFLAVVAPPLLDKLVREVDRAVSRAQLELQDGSDRSGAARHRAGAKSGTGGGGGFLGTFSMQTNEKGGALAGTLGGGGGGGGADGSSRGRDGEALSDAAVALLEVADAFKRRAAVLADALRVRRSDNRAVAALKALEGRLDTACLQSCVDLVESVRSDSRRNVPDNAAVHVLSSGTLRAIKRTMRYRNGYEALAGGAKLPWDKGGGGGSSSGPGGAADKSPPRAPDDLAGAENCGEAKALPRFTALANELMRALIDNLVEKSKAYPAGRAGEARRHLFLLNNANYLYANCRRAIGDGSGGGGGGTEAFRAGPRASVTNASMHSAASTSQHRSAAAAAARSRENSATTPRAASGGVGRGGESPVPSAGTSPGLSPPPQRGGAGTPLAMGGNSFFRGTPVQGDGSSRGFNADRSPFGTAMSDADGGAAGGESDPVTASLSPSDFLTAQTLWLLQRMVTEKVGAYADLLFDPLCLAVIDDVGQLEYQRGGRLLTLECGRLIKAKFSSFNDGWEEVLAGQKGACVSDPTLRQRLRDEARGRVATEYRRLYDRYADVQFSKKHQGQYLRFTPDAVESGIEELFGG